MLQYLFKGNPLKWVLTEQLPDQVFSLKWYLLFPNQTWKFDFAINSLIGNFAVVIAVKRQGAAQQQVQDNT